MQPMTNMLVFGCIFTHRSSLEMSTPIVTGLSMLVFITEPKFFRINFIAPQPTVMYL